MRLLLTMYYKRVRIKDFLQVIFTSVDYCTSQSTALENTMENKKKEKSIIDWENKLIERFLKAERSQCPPPPCLKVKKHPAYSSERRGWGWGADGACLRMRYLASWVKEAAGNSSNISSCYFRTYHRTRSSASTIFSRARIIEPHVQWQLIMLQFVNEKPCPLIENVIPNWYLEYYSRVDVLLILFKSMTEEMVWIYIHYNKQ